MRTLVYIQAMNLSQRLERSLPSLLFLLAFGFTLPGVNPTFYVDDSPETVTACATFGIPHPPGYPLHTMVGHLFSKVPVGAVPFRVNLLSCSLAACVCVGLFLLMTRRFGVRPLLAAPLALFWMVGTTTYPAALSAKTGIYELTGLFLLAILAALSAGKLPLACFLYGLSFANHWMSMVAFLPGFVVLALMARKGKVLEAPGSDPTQGPEGNAPSEEGQVPLGSERFLPPGRWIALFTLFLLGTSLYLLLPLRAHQGPSLNWGEPSSLGHFIDGFLRSQYSPGEGKGSATDRAGQFGASVGIAFKEFPWLLPFLLVGLLGGARGRLPVPGLLLTWGSLVWVLSLYLDLPKDQYFLIADYTLPAHLFLLLFAGAGVCALSDFLKARSGRDFLPFLALVLALLAVLQGVRRHEGMGQGRYTGVHDLCLNRFRALPEGSLYFVRADSQVFSTWYFRWVEGKRKDLCVVGVDGLPMDWVRERLRKDHPGLHLPLTNDRFGAEAAPALARWILDKNPTLPHWVGFIPGLDGMLPNLKVLPYGVCAKALGEGEAPFLDEGLSDKVWRGMRLRNLQEVPLDDRTRTRVTREYGVYRNLLGLHYEKVGDDLRTQITPRSKPQDLLTVSSNYERSYDHYLWATGWSPEVPEHPFNVGNALYNMGRVTESIAWYEKAAALRTDYKDAWFNAGVAAYQSGSYRKARESFEKVLALDPDHAQARHGVDYITQQGLAVKEDQDEAHSHGHAH